MAGILEAAAGRWPTLLMELGGLTSEQLTNKHQPCPACGGKDRYRWDNDDGPGGGFCNRCGGKDHAGGALSGLDLLMRVRGWELKQALGAVAQHLGIADRPPPPTQGAKAFWRYSLDFIVCRFSVPGDKKIRPLWWSGTQWLWKSCPAPRPLYWASPLRSSVPVLIVEGEKTADAAVKLFPGHAVCTWPGGCQSIDKACWDSIRDRNVVLWPDADAVGRKAMDQLATRLAANGCTVTIVDPPADLPEAWDLADATDWTPQQTADVVKQRSRILQPVGQKAKVQAEDSQLSYRELLALALEAVRADDEDAEMTIRAEIMTRFRRNDGQITAALFRLLSLQMQVAPSEKPTYRSIDLSRVVGIDWLLEGFIPDNDQALLFAPAGAGKTTAALAMAFAVTDGTGFLDHEAKAASGNVLLIASDSGAGPLIRTLAEMGRGDDPALRPSPEDNRLHVWAHDPEQGAMAWEASLRGCLRLLEFVQEQNIRLVLIDSCKAVTSKADVNYCDNGQVTALLTFCKEVLCQHCAVVWINHEGTGAGEAAGAKAWKEIPSIVHSIELVPLGAEDDGNGRKPKTTRTSTTMRSWRVRKCRQGTAREFLYQVDGLTGRLVVSAQVEVKRDCRALIVDVLHQAQQNGRPSLSLKAIAEELQALGGYSRGTVSNSLTRMTGARYPEVVRVGSKPGHYRLAPRITQQLDEAAKAEA